MLGNTDSYAFPLPGTKQFQQIILFYLPLFSQTHAFINACLFLQVQKGNMGNYFKMMEDFSLKLYPQWLVQVPIICQASEGIWPDMEEFIK